MSNPQAQQAVKPQGAATFDARRLPQCWFLADIVAECPAYGWNVGGHVYISRTESGLYRVLRYGRAWLVSEGVAKRHFARVIGSDGAAVRVAQQDRWTATWYEAMSEARRAA